MKLYDQNGDECQMTGLPHMFYDKVAVDERIAELEKYRRAVEDHNKSCVDRCAGASKCGYMQYFLNNGRRCPNCPVFESIEL